DPVPCHISGRNMASDPAFELTKARGDIAIVAGIECWAENDEQGAVAVAAHPQRMRRLIDTDKHTVDD
ncbi:MAG TPA: hypothetical protein VIG52_02485, partial [Methyloceanibacter sp.]